MGRPSAVGIRWGQVEVFSSDEKIDTIYSIFEKIMGKYGAPGALSKEDMDEEKKLLADDVDESSAGELEASDESASADESPPGDANEEAEEGDESPWLKAARRREADS